MNKTSIRRMDLVYPELSYRITGILFDVFNKLGYQYQEKYYQRSIGHLLRKLTIPFKEQVYAPIEFDGKTIGGYFYDFLVDDKIILEIKRGDRFSRSDIGQILAYLKRANIKLGILARFSSKGLKFKRVINFD